MTHIVTYNRKTDGAELSEKGRVVFDKYVAEGKLTMVIDEDQAEMKFVDEATADAYFAEMKTIGEDKETGNLRGAMTRRNV